MLNACQQIKMGDVGKIFKSFKILLVAAFITFSILIIHKNSVFDIFKEFNASIEEKKDLNNISEPVVGKFSL